MQSANVRHRSIALVTVKLSTRVDKSWGRRQTLTNSKEKIAYLWRIGRKLKAYTSCVPYLKVFKNDLY